MNCWSCSKTLAELDYGRGDVCPGCRRDTRVCKNCGYYDTRYDNSCKETQADRVVDKEKSNFCDYFKPGTTAGARGPTANDLKAAAEALFKKKS